MKPQDYHKALDELERLQRENADEHQIRLKYQGLVYLVCAELDHALGRHVSNGTGTLADEESVMKAVRLLAAKLAATEAALNSIRSCAELSLRSRTRYRKALSGIRFMALIDSSAAIDAAKTGVKSSHPEGLCGHIGCDCYEDAARGDRP